MASGAKEAARRAAEERRLERMTWRKSARSEGVKGWWYIRRICLTRVDLPDSPAPRRRSWGGEDGGRVA